MAGCEWNPDLNRAAVEGDGHSERFPAIWSVGNGRWHLCDYCAQLPTFKRLTARTRIKGQDQANG